MTRPFETDVAAHLRGLAALAERVASELSGEIAMIAGLVLEAADRDATLFFCGNGGSAADAQHLATEYVVRFRRNRRALRAIALTTDTSLLTAAANDFGFPEIFARQVAALGRSGDLLFLHSTSGDSENLIEAARAARIAGLTTIALLARGGGALRPEVDVALVLPTDVGAHAQEVQMSIGHVICDVVERRVAEEAPDS